MGTSCTYHVIGVGEEKDGKSLLYPAISQLERVQQVEKAKRQGDKIIDWHSQTRTGEKLLKKPLKLATVVCPKCSGFGCSICNVSGITTKRWLSGFQAWQLKPDL